MLLESEMIIERHELLHYNLKDDGRGKSTSSEERNETYCKLMTGQHVLRACICGLYSRWWSNTDSCVGIVGLNCNFLLSQLFPWYLCCFWLDFTRFLSVRFPCSHLSYGLNWDYPHRSWVLKYESFYNINFCFIHIVVWTVFHPGPDKCKQVPPVWPLGKCLFTYMATELSNLLQNTVAVPTGNIFDQRKDCRIFKNIHIKMKMGREV